MCKCTKNNLFKFYFLFYILYIHASWSLKKIFFFFIQLDYRAFSIGSSFKALWIKKCHKREFSYTCIYMYKWLYLLNIESPRRICVYMYYGYHIKVVQINTSTTVYVAQGCLSNCVWLDTLTVAWVHVSIIYSYWKLKKWVHTISDSEDVVEMWRKDGGRGVGWLGVEYITAIPFF